MINRKLEQLIKTTLKNQNKIIIVYGARQVGKTTLLKKIVTDYEHNVLWVNGDRASYQEFLSVRSLEKIRQLIGLNNYIVIDEAQNIPDIGVNLKIIYDELPDLKVIITGSSVLELANTTRETLAGRNITFQLYPISLGELRDTYSDFHVIQNLETYLLYGMYPEVVMLEGIAEKKQLLQDLVDSYLYKDVLQLSNIKNSDKIYKLLQLLAYQIGSLVSIHELAKNLNLHPETVNNYIDLLEKGFVLQRLSGFSGNPRKEISKMDKIFFTDLGIRNMLINDFSPLDVRNDKGAIWENFAIIERMKVLQYRRSFKKMYFWKRYSGAELDLIEIQDGKILAMEFKWNKMRKSPPSSWTTQYKNTEYYCINKNNIFDLVELS